ncbi:hypothetical protein GGR52DRAFT_549426 [Hypoxylon sp. FL1284]|nr:hypothetical protein GGR52DRAFT_549426 [Hypoxylon sp. FL1284]
MARLSDEEVAHRIAYRVITALTKKPTVQVTDRWKQYLERNLSPTEISDALWSESSCEEDSKAVRWQNRFISSSMRYILHRRGLLPHRSGSYPLQHSQYWARDQAMKRAEVILVAMDCLCTPGCVCSWKICLGLAVGDDQLSEIKDISRARRQEIGRLLACELSGIQELPGQPLYHPATVLGLL